MLAVIKLLGVLLGVLVGDVLTNRSVHVFLPVLIPTFSYYFSLS